MALDIIDKGAEGDERAKGDQGDQGEKIALLSTEGDAIHCVISSH